MNTNGEEKMIPKGWKEAIVGATPEAIIGSAIEMRDRGKNPFSLFHNRKWTAQEQYDALVYAFYASHIALLEQMIVENESKRKKKGQDIIPDGRWNEGHDFALDLINTDLRAKIEELKKTNISN